MSKYNNFKQQNNYNFRAISKAGAHKKLLDIATPLIEQNKTVFIVDDENNYVALNETFGFNKITISRSIFIDVLYPIRLHRLLPLSSQPTVDETAIQVIHLLKLITIERIGKILGEDFNLLDISKYSILHRYLMSTIRDIIGNFNHETNLKSIALLLDRDIKDEVFQAFCTALDELTCENNEHYNNFNIPAPSIEAETFQTLIDMQDIPKKTYLHRVVKGFLTHFFLFYIEHMHNNKDEMIIMYADLYSSEFEKNIIFNNLFEDLIRRSRMRNCGVGIIHHDDSDNNIARSIRCNVLNVDTGELEC